MIQHIMGQPAAWAAITAIVCLSILEAVALLNHVDGSTFGITIAAIAGLGGYTVGKVNSLGKSG